MGTKIRQSLIAGIAGTVVMTLIMLIAPMMGMPKMNPATMLSGMMGIPVTAGWILHFMIGIIFATAYFFAFFPLVKISNKILKGALFGLAVFVFAQIMMGVMGAIMPMPPMEGSMVLMMVGSIIGHMVYGIIVAILVKD